MTPELRAQFMQRVMQIGMRPAAREFDVTYGAASGMIYRARNPTDGSNPMSVLIQREKLPRIYTKQVSVMVDPEMYAQIERLAERDGVTKSQIGRELLEWALERFGDE